MVEIMPTVQLDRLNEDVLRIILDLAVHGIESDFYKSILQSPQTVIRISHVSRQFRSLAFSTPTLWTNIHGFMLPEAILAFLERSGNADLRLTFVIDDNEKFVRSVGDEVDGDVADMLFRDGSLFDAASPHSKRWRSIHVLPEVNIHEGCYPFLHWQTARLRCSLALQDGPFPRLQHLDVRFNEPIPMHKDFYACWDASALRELVIANSPPCISRFASLTKFTFVWDQFQWSPQNPSFERELLAFLQATPSLQDLSFRINRNGIGLLDYASLRFEATHPLELPNITSLSLLTVSLAMAPTFHALLDRLYLPNLSRLVIHAGVDGRGCRELKLISSDLKTFIWTLSMLPDPALSQRLKDVELRIFAGTEHNYRERQLQIPFVKLEHVENLTLETDMRLVWSFSVDSGNDNADSWTFDLLSLTNHFLHPINIRSLRFERCSNVDAQLVRTLLETLKRQGKRDGFKAVSAFECDPALKNSLEEIIPQDTLLWLS